MEVDATTQAVAQQQDAALSQDGLRRALRSTRAGQLYTADWKTELVQAGYAFNVTVGGVSAGANVLLITGGGNGTTINSDVPEMAIGTPAGYFHVPLGFTCSIQQDFGNADADEANIILFADLEKRIPAPVIASSTLETPLNLLDGGPDSVSRAMSACHTADIADPVCTVLLAYSTIQAAQVGADSTVVGKLKCNFDPSFPSLFKGPCSVVACWGGTTAATGLASYTWAEVPVARFE